MDHHTAGKAPNTAWRIGPEQESANMADKTAPNKTAAEKKTADKTEDKRPFRLGWPWSNPARQTDEDPASGADQVDGGVDTAPSLQLTDEARLVEDARSNPASFGVLYERYVDRIYAYVYHRVGNNQDAEDLTARTFYRALDRLETYEDRGLPFSAWLFRIAHNLVANWHRDHNKRRFLSWDRLWPQGNEGRLADAMVTGATPPEMLSPDTLFEQAESHDALWAAINRLPVERRDLLLYKFSSRLSNVEIGKLMNKSEGAVKSLYFRTLSSLRKDLEARGWGLEGFDAGIDAAGTPIEESNPSGWGATPGGNGAGG